MSTLNSLGKRRRVTATASKACEECSRRKSKCDLYQPVCSRCAARNMSCVYSERKKPGPTKGCVLRTNKDRLQDNSDHCEKPSFQYVQENNSKHLRHSKSNQISSSQKPFYDSEPSESPSIDDIVDWEQILGSYCSNSRQTGTSPGPSRQLLHAESPPSQAHRMSTSHDYLPLGVSGLQLRENLIKLYLSREQLCFPLFPAFRADKAFSFVSQEDEHSILLDAICAISARYLDDPNFLAADKQSHAGDFFASRAKARHLARINDENFSSLNLDTIKTSLLLAIYDLTRYPSPKSWSSISETIRLAYELGLDKLDGDGASVHGNITPEEREDRRYVWWSIWKLDAFFGCVCSRPFAIDTHKIETLLASVPLEEFFTTGAVTTKARRPLPSDLSRAWKHVLGLKVGDCQELYFITNAFMREVATLRRLQSSQQDVNQRLFLLENALSSFRIAMPEILQGETVLSPRQNEGLSTQRVEAETLLLLHHTSILLYLPNRHDIHSTSQQFTSGISGTLPPSKVARLFQSQWPKCLQFACSMQEIARDLPPVVISSLSPTASSGLWYSGLILTLQALTTEDEDERRRMFSEIDIVLAILGRMGKCWDIAGLFYDVLDSLITSTTHIRTLSDIRHLLKEWNGPHFGNPMVARSSSSLTMIPRENSDMDEMSAKDNSDALASLDEGVCGESDNGHDNRRGEFGMANELDWLHDDILMCLDAFCGPFQSDTEAAYQV